ncbi:MAG: Flp pilus assembly protein TadG [Hyphomicrobiaceae bacterium]|jgi:Flp pilus assembly protein TadG
MRHENQPSNRNRRQRGVVSVEFAILVPVLAMLILGGVDFGRAFFENHLLLEGARAGVRVAALPRKTNDEVRAAVNQVLSSGGVTVTNDGIVIEKAGWNGNTGETAVVTVNHTFTPTVGRLIPNWSNQLMLSQTVRARHE